MDKFVEISLNYLPELIPYYKHESAVYGDLNIFEFFDGCLVDYINDELAKSSSLSQEFVIKLINFLGSAIDFIRKDGISDASNSKIPLEYDLVFTICEALPQDIVAGTLYLKANGALKKSIKRYLESK